MAGPLLTSNNLSSSVSFLAAALMAEPSRRPNMNTSSTQPLICITGALPSGRSKMDYFRHLRENGFILTDHLTKEVQVLVVANPLGSESAKTKKARKWGLPIEDEAWLSRISGWPL